MGIITDRRIITEDSPAKRRIVHEKINLKYPKNSKAGGYENDHSINFSSNIGIGGTRSTSPNVIESNSNWIY